MSGAKGILGTAGLVAAGLGVMLSGVGGSYALWSDAAGADPGSLTSGTAGMRAQWAAGYDQSLWHNLLPAESVRQPFVLTNTGDVPMTLSVSASAVSGFEVRALASSCAAAALPTNPLNATPSALLVSAGDTVPVTLASGASLTACLEVRVTSSAVPGASTAFTTTIDGRQTP